MNITILRGIVYCLLLGQLCFAQEQGFVIPDSLENKSYIELYNAHRKAVHDTVKSLTYLNTYLEKGKRDNNQLHRAVAYSLIAYYEADDNKKLKYLDSSIVTISIC
ncbi:MAG: hypothetical protein AAF934_07345 [Bacteroidota bacterium]